MLRVIIQEENQFCHSNPTIIICNPDLEGTLNRKALHVTELEEIVTNRLLLIPAEFQNYYAKKDLKISKFSLVDNFIEVVKTLPEYDKTKNYYLTKN